MTLPVETERWSLNPADIVDLPSMATLLTQRTNAVSRFLWEHMAELTRQLLSNYVSGVTNEVRLQKILMRVL
jgi:hypothetical protein